MLEETNKHQYDVRISEAIFKILSSSQILKLHLGSNGVNLSFGSASEYSIAFTKMRQH